MTDFAAALSHLTVVDDATADEIDRAQRREKLRDTWMLAPRGLLKANCDPKLERAVEQWRGGSLILLGSTGVGKSAAAVRLLARLCKAGADDGGEAYELARGCFWTLADDIITAGGAKNNEAAERLLHRSHWCRLLFLDDVARSSSTLHSVLKHRYDKGLHTILTSGAKDPPGLARMLGGDAVFRWVIESGRPVGKVVIA